MFLFYLFICMSHSWSGEPHEIILQIAMDMLSQKQRNWITKLISYWPSEPQELYLVANWQDMIISDTDKVFSQWHFSDVPLIDENYTLEDPEITFNVSSTIADAMDSIMDETTTSVWSLLFNFRNLFHFVGDAHCPVHAVTFYSEYYPNGDAGGNGRYTDCSLVINGSKPYFCKSLHKVWDSVVLDYDSNKYDAPFMKEYWENITKLKKTFPQSSFGDLLDERDPHKWVIESFEVAKNYAYGKLYKDKYLTKNYLDECSVEAKRRVTLAGYRLGKLLQRFFDERGYITLPADPIYTTEIVAWILDSILFLFIILYTIKIVVHRHRSHEEFSESWVRVPMAP